jgi:4-amino-4-deoxy-L-arabinose transferase-like glycosyltransferase
MELPGSQSKSTSGRAVIWLLLIVALCLGSYLRLKSLGLRSLWHDEFSTWYVSRMPLADSLKWQPELTKPPLYQLTLRGLSQDERPAEWILRLPAALSGILLVLAAYWQALPMTSRGTAAALALLIACNALQIEYSQEARPYTMMVLWCTLATGFWFRLIEKPRPITLVGYVATGVLAFHSHYLSVLMFPAHLGWWLLLPGPQRRIPRAYPLVGMIATGFLSTPIVVHYFMTRTETFQGLDWIDPPTLASALESLKQLTVGPLWLVLMLLPAAIAWIAGLLGWKFASLPAPGGTISAGKRDAIILLALWFACAWGGLIVMSWLGRPALVVRYALPAAVPLLLIPLVIYHRLDRRSPLILASVMVIASAPDWIDKATQYEPGIRELVEYVHKNAHPQDDLVVVTIDNTTHRNWQDMERAAFQYYSLEGLAHDELSIAADGVSPMNDILNDPRAMYLIVGWADPFAILSGAGRVPQPIFFDGESHSQLLFDPFRLVRVTPVPAGSGR